MTAQQQELLEALADAGWELAGTEELNEWWADQVWVMRSVWSPQGSRFFLTFLVDPMKDLHRKRRSAENVWAVKASATLPTARQEADGEFTLSLGHGWAGRLNAFVEDLSRFRPSRAI